MSEILQCEICGEEAETTCQNCGQYVCGACCQITDWGENEQITVCDSCMGVFDDYSEMDTDHFTGAGWYKERELS